MKKYFFIAALALIIAGCTKSTKVEFTGNAPGMNDGEFIIKDTGEDTIVCKSAIKAGEFAASRELNNPGYYTMMITNAQTGSLGFDVYVEPGSYNVTLDAKKLYKYPVIETSSKKQNELSAFYNLSDTVNAAVYKKTKDLMTQINDPKAKALSPAAYAELEAKLTAAKAQESKPNALIAFVNKYPDNEIGMHLLLNSDYRNDPVTYYEIFKKLSATQKNGANGKVMGMYLDSVSKATPK